MNALHLLEGLRQDGVTFALEGAEVLVLTLPSAVQLHALAIDGRDWSTGLVAAVQQFDHYVHVLRDDARMPESEAEALAWAMLLAGSTAPGD